MDTPETSSRTAERRFKTIRDVAFALGVAGVALTTEVHATELTAGTIVSLYTAGTFEALRFFSSPESPRKKRIMNRVNKGIAAMMFTAAAMSGAEGVSLVAQDQEPIGVGLMNIRDFLTLEETTPPDSDFERYGFATADLAYAAWQVALGVSSVRRRKNEDTLISADANAAIG